MPSKDGPKATTAPTTAPPIRADQISRLARSRSGFPPTQGIFAPPRAPAFYEGVLVKPRRDFFFVPAPCQAPRGHRAPRHRASDATLPAAVLRGRLPST